jgi:hypothetical protein
MFFKILIALMGVSIGLTSFDPRLFDHSNSKVTQDFKGNVFRQREQFFAQRSQVTWWL